MTALAEKFGTLQTDSVRDEEEISREISPSVKEALLNNLDSITIKQIISELQIPKRRDSRSFPELSKEQKSDYEEFRYKCYDKVEIPGIRLGYPSNRIVINGKDMKLGDALFILFLRFLVELKKGLGGWVNTADLEYEGIISDQGKYQPYSNLRDKLEGGLDAKKFIQNDGEKNYRISVHPDFITYDKERLLQHKGWRIREQAQRLP